MLKVSDAFLAAMKYAPYIVRLTLDDQDIIEGKAALSFNAQGGTNGSSDAITLGGTVSGTVTVTLDKEHVACALEKRKLFLELGIDIGTETEWIPVGSYKVSDVSEDDGNVILTAGDALSTEFDVEYEPLDGFDFSSEKGVDSAAFLTAICERRGVEVDVNGLAAIPLKSSPEGYTERRIIGFISALHGGFADIDRYGVLKIRWYTESGVTVDADRYYENGMEKASYDFCVNWLKCYVEPMEETLIMGDAEAEQGISFECPWMTEERFAEIWEKVQNFSYRPVAGLRFFGDPRLDPGDIINLEDLSGAVHSVPVMKISHEWDGGIVTQISAEGQVQTDEYEGPVEREQKRINARILKKQREIELSIRNFDGDKIISLINLSESEAYIKAPKIRLEGIVTANSNFKILADGSVEATNASISGKITANTGKIGPWTITESGMYYGSADGSDGGAALGGTYLFTSVGSGWRSVYWYQVHECVTEWVLTESSESDADVKNSISGIDDYDTLFDSLKPRRYKYNHGTSDRYHTGFIAQEVVDAINSAGMTTQDFAGVVKLEQSNKNGCQWLLRRDEFVALNTWQIQKLKERVAALEELAAQKM